MLTLNNINESFRKYNNFYLTNVSSQAVSAPSPRPKHTAAAQSEPDREKVAAAGGFLALIGLALNTVSKWCGDKLMAGKELTDPKNGNVQKIANDMVSKNKLDVVVDYIDHANKGKYGLDMARELEVVARGQNAFFADKAVKVAGEVKNLAVAPVKKPSLILHELGHAINSAKGGILKLMQKSRAYVGFAPAILLTLNGLAPDRTPGRDNIIERNAGKLGFLAFLPTIIEEGLASMRGINAAKVAQKAGMKGLKLGVLKKNYFFAWMTYLIAGIGLGVAAKQAFVEKKLQKS
jgi:hypothetical protein